MFVWECFPDLEVIEIYESIVCGILEGLCTDTNFNKSYDQFASIFFPTMVDDKNMDIVDIFQKFQANDT